MKKESIICNIRKYRWKYWLERPVGAFATSFVGEGFKPEFYEAVTSKGILRKAVLYQNGFWCKCEKTQEKDILRHKEFFEKNSIFDITRKHDAFSKRSNDALRILINAKMHPFEKFRRVNSILAEAGAYIFLTLLLEVVYDKRLNEEVPIYFIEGIAKFVSEASIPKKLTASARMEEAMRRKVNPAKIAEEFGWITVRDGFSKPITAQEIKIQMKHLPDKQKPSKITIPKELTSLFEEIQELVYFRTARTDLYHELLYKCRPIFIELADQMNIPFLELKHYSAQSIIAGKPQKYSDKFAMAIYNGEDVITDEEIVHIEVEKAIGIIKGVTAYGGIARGKAKIVHTEYDTDKVKEGDILLTHMTIPSFITAMRKASAFVTDEGGITCHAAIVAREMRKPCIIGTRIATKFFKDEDLVEVDADKGTIKKL